MQRVRGMPFLHVYRNNRYAILEIKEANKSVLSQDMPTTSLAIEFLIKP
jgi:hypothetical protein